MTLIGFHTTFLNGAGTIEATVVVDELQTRHPKAFGPNGGNSRALAIASILWILGSFAGPVTAGALNDKVGYYTMNCVVGE
ncbi:major facilitator superfamily domain-containing protein [Penicillium vulpinum]|uniref:major facilitator superfamily domain-containing protein n=1 Tax=Penicillium vulpinum TaxID=29845 RepID=UPI00254691CB|nr:major facilitator superfamily domain-containing protein [Penicillium vulpinum]KAJ5958674.1 major facilitator superfamily domain-containing protein [Penicillium vulpinum]